MANLKVGTQIEIRENYKPMYRLFGNKGKIKSQNTTCQQYNQSERVDYYDVEAISLISKKMELIPVKKIHCKETNQSPIKQI